jgi:hypothetical protein
MGKNSLLKNVSVGKVAALVKPISLFFTAWQASSDLMGAMLNGPQPEADVLTQGWLDHKLNELQLVCLTVCMRTYLF